jgi:purine-binding chemotaxis protein CheW
MVDERRERERRERGAGAGGAGAPPGANRRFGERRGAVAPGALPSALEGIVDGSDFLSLTAEEIYRQSYAPEVAPDRAECLAFRLGDEEYALDIEVLREIIFPPPVTIVPRAPEEVVGVLALRGSMVTVVDLRRRLGFDSQGPTGRTRILVVHHQDELYGLVVDAVSEVVRYMPTAIEPPPPTHRRMESDYVRGVIYHEQRLLIVLELDRLLAFGEAR